MLGDATMTTSTSASEGYSRSWQQGGLNNTGGANVSYSDNRSYQTHARALLQPAEVLRLSGETVLVFVRNVPPLMLRRIKYYSDPLFRSLSGMPVLWWRRWPGRSGWRHGRSSRTKLRPQPKVRKAWLRLVTVTPPAWLGSAWLS